MNEVKRWKCPNGHTLGVVRRSKIGGAHVTRLELFRQALADGEGDVDVMAVVEGTVLNVRCSVPGCGESRTWVLGDDALEGLLQRYFGGVR